MTNNEFCYWLQGYFEIASDAVLNKKHLHLILGQINQIEEPLHPYCVWLKNTLSMLAFDAPSPIFEFFTHQMREKLAQIFLHVIDNSYDTILSPDELQAIHQGTLNPTSEDII